MNGARMLERLKSKNDHLASTIPASSEPSSTAASRGRSSRWKRRIASGTAVAIIAALFLISVYSLLPLGSKHGLNPAGGVGPVPGVSDSPVQLAADLPPAYQLRTVYVPHSLGTRTLISNFALREHQYSPDNISVPNDGVLLSIQQLPSSCACQASSEPPTIDAGALHPFGTEMISGDLVFRSGHTLLAVFATFGSLHVRDGDLRDAQSVLDSLRASPLGHADAVPVLLAPTFPDSSPWYEAESSSIRGDMNEPTSWLSNEPLAQADLAYAARVGTLPFPYIELTSLSSDGVLVFAAFLGGTGQSPNPNFPARSLPLSLSDAAALGRWEGQPASNVPQYQLGATVGGRAVDVRIFFGTQDPSASTLATAQAMLGKLSV